MKITQIQAKSLAAKIVRELENDREINKKNFVLPKETDKIISTLVKNFNKALEQAKFRYKEFEDYMHEVYKKPYAESLGNINRIEDVSMNCVLDYIKNYTYPRIRVNVDTIYDDIIVESIECDNIAELISKLKDKYTVNNIELIYSKQIKPMHPIKTIMVRVVR